MPDQNYNTGDGLTQVDEPEVATNSTYGEIAVTGPGVSVTRPVDEETLARVVTILFGVG